MKLIRVRFLQPTNNRGARLIATDGQLGQIVVPYQYRDDAQEKLAAAQQFVENFMPYSPKLDPIPGEFCGDSYFHFVPK